MLKREETSKRR